MQDNPTDATGIGETRIRADDARKVIIPREPESAKEMFGTESKFAIDPAACRTEYSFMPAGR